MSSTDTTVVELQLQGNTTTASTGVEDTRWNSYPAYAGKVNYYSKRLQNVVKVAKSNVLVDSILSIQIITSKPIL